MGMAIDVESRRPVIGANQAGLSGPAIKPMALLKVHQVYQVARRHRFRLSVRAALPAPRTRSSS